MIDVKAKKVKIVCDKAKRDSVVWVGDVPELGMSDRVFDFDTVTGHGLKRAMLKFGSDWDRIEIVLTRKVREEDL